MTDASRTRALTVGVEKLSSLLERICCWGIQLQWRWKNAKGKHHYTTDLLFVLAGQWTFEKNYCQITFFYFSQVPQALHQAQDVWRLLRLQDRQAQVPAGGVAPKRQRRYNIQINRIRNVVRRSSQSNPEHVIEIVFALCWPKRIGTDKLLLTQTHHTEKSKERNLLWRPTKLTLPICTS